MNRGSQRYVLRGLCQGSDSHGCGVWLGESEIHRAGGQGGQAGTLSYGLKLLSAGGIYSASAEPQDCSDFT